MIARAVAAQVPARWVAAGADVIDLRLRRFLEKSRLWFVIGTATEDRLSAVVGGHRGRHSAEALAAMVAPDAWMSAPGTARGHGYRWARVRLPGGWPGRPSRWLLLRRDAGTGENLRAYLCQTGPATTLPELADVALLLERNRYVLAAACAGAGLDEYEVRCWTSWYRYTTFALAAHNCLELAGRCTEATEEQDIREARAPCPRRPRPADAKEETCPSQVQPNTPRVPCVSRYGTISSSVTGTVRQRHVRSPFPAYSNGRRPGWVR